ncbi:uncharacterized protein LOC114279916 [Camellia sinensis]|uniref:uncharacterized protein LOC114279916 n=1 Tax=Camellia sinensis TaxID=4442 RepID=UPI001035FD2C|nr:uncharacterized protein LOC114279916 [Camellia sinensis]
MNHIWPPQPVTISGCRKLPLENSLFVKESKCSFGQPRVEYLGHIISEDGVEVDPSKIKTMVESPTPKHVWALRGFLGLTDYYRKFVKDYENINAPLKTLSQKDAFNWGPDAEAAFVKLKDAMTSAPVLALPDFL